MRLGGTQVAVCGVMTAPSAQQPAISRGGAGPQRTGKGRLPAPLLTRPQGFLDKEADGEARDRPLWPQETRNRNLVEVRLAHGPAQFTNILL